MQKSIKEQRAEGLVFTYKAANHQEQRVICKEKDEQI